jgi:hypothetical protein
VRYREVYVLLEELADATLTARAKPTSPNSPPCRCHAQAADDRRRGPPRTHHAPPRSCLDHLTFNRPVEDWGKLLGDTPAITAMLDRLLEHGHVLTCGPKSWRMKAHTALRREGPPQ